MAIEDPPEAERSNPNLPPDIITEILLLLPVKSLLQFRSVSKSWRSLISDPKFVKTHLTISSKDDEIAHHKLIFISDTAMKTCHLSPVLNGFSVNAMELDYPMNPDVEVQNLRSINGLIFISTFSHGTFLWNPSTRISKKLPDSEIKLMSGTDERSSTVDLMYGFGYDASTDDYKVVETLCNMFSPDKYGTEVMVYSSRTGFWTRVGEFPPVRWLNWDSVFVNGAIHWAAVVTDDSFLVYLDVANETWGEIALPSDRRRSSVSVLRDGYIGVGVLREGLCVMHYFCRDCTDLWIMKEYGVRESWTKLTSIPYMKMHNEPEPLYLSKKGKILLECVPRIVLYDPQSRLVEDPDICNFDKCYKSTTYVESLVSPMMMIQEGPERQQ